ncbi:alpha/beta fold hydrolase [Enterococcus dispar]|uniref:Alpha/beta hydrolase fold-5 domain-containing protein n=1 Tax=Enterococcus dispar ATCC 51266 TaxID=1139219 RepID=S0KII6_9ENTE|nr:alpha/beta fold hydrolase [Enterococcus dispar]EOT40755.1 hypothetical protein OMK_01670 [Enterococcus dispar ATCC 51266]EOW86872.1 hypothetical protein I569_02236 [Enterococcus dispar ATCC 51266]MCU7357783.1 alpha/beta hydrolase [Enterococcus dispar]MDT2706210.1 alpha/beta fold hydrolase [Enterococcus dispar]
MKKWHWWQKMLLGILVVFLFVAAGGSLYLKENTYKPSKDAKVIKPTKVTKDYALFVSSQPNKNEEQTNLIFYPGALVAPSSYRIWAQEVADAGYSVYILNVPLNLAVLAPNKADVVLAKNAQAKNILVGHSLGGVMASRYAQNHQKEIAGMIFLASYPDEKGSLKKVNIPVLSITASQDQVLNKTQYQKSKAYLPDNTTFAEIKGGNHAGFGSYGAQKGDGKATISNSQQQQELSKYIITWLKEIK